MAITTDQPTTTTPDNHVADSSFTVVIEAPVENVDIPAWCYSLSDAEYQACSPAHIAAGATTTPDGRRMSINVEDIGGSVMIQHYVEEIGQPNHLRLVSQSDLFTSSGRTKLDVIWDLSVKRLDDTTCEFTNSVQSFAPPEMIDFIASQGIPLEIFRAGRGPISEAHNRQETPMFAKSIERHALTGTNLADIGRRASAPR
ncbi:MAG TPA: hypothetical protein VN880_12610 [Solirubrobacteraceae bacterium]|nr:hypothetical protein [Solirubrobacteraceae bacterium]